MTQTLGEKIKALRLDSGVSLRQFAGKIDITPAFMSDIELGRRFPSDEVLIKIAQELNVPFDQLKTYDVRESLTDLRKLVGTSQEWGLAFRTVAEQVKSGLTPQDLIRRLAAKGSQSNESD